MIRGHCPITVALALAFAVFPVAQARTLHVAPNADAASATGEPAHPFSDLTSAAAGAQPGDEIELHGGLYPNTRMRLTLQGTKEHPIVIRNAPGEKPVLDGGSVVGSSEGPEKGDVPGVLDLRDSHFVVIDGLEIAHSPGYGLSLWECEDITVKNCDIHHSWSRALGGSGARLRFERNHLHDAVLQNADPSAKGFWSSGGATWYRKDGSPSRNIVWRENVIERIWGEGLNALHVDGALLERNVVRNAYSVLLYVDHSRNVVIDGNDLRNTTNAFARRDTKEIASGVLLASEHYPQARAFPVENIRVLNNTISNVAAGVGYWRDAENTDPTNTYCNVLISRNVISPAGAHAIQFASAGPDSRADCRNEITDNIVYKGRASVFLADASKWRLSGNSFPKGKLKPRSKRPSAR